MDLRKAAREIHLEALEKVRIGPAVRRRLRFVGSSLCVDDRCLPLDTFSDVVLVAVGKAALPMTAEMMAILDPQLPGHQRVRGIVVSPCPPPSVDPRLQYVRGGHPLPDADSFAAAAAVLATLRQCTAQSLVFFLISGGASAMMESPDAASIAPEDLTRFHQVLVHSGLSIGQMNALRKHLSAVKGGRLAKAAGQATMCTLLVSDVPPQAPEAIGSGPSMPDPTTLEDCRLVLNSSLGSWSIPQSVRDGFADPLCPETPKAADSAFLKASWHTLLSSDDLCRAACEAALAHGFHVEVDNACDEQNYETAARHLLSHLQRMASGPRPACLISAGEIAVPIQGPHGLGGRNQQFALYCAQIIAEWDIHVAVLSAGSDGIDGNSPAAGAVIDNNTATSARMAGFSIGEALASFNAYPLLHALGEDIKTGPSGNNLRDLRLLLLG